MSSSRPSWPWLVKGSSATSVSMPSSGKRFFSSRTARGTRPSGLVASRPSARLQRRVDHREQRHHRDAERHALLGHGQQAVEAEALHAGHARRRPAPARGRRARTPAGSGPAARSAVLAHQCAGEARRGAGGAGGWRERAVGCARACGSVIDAAPRLRTARRVHVARERVRCHKPQLRLLKSTVE